MAIKDRVQVAPWFYAAEELGEHIGIRFGIIKDETKRPEWIFLPHTEVDGIGGFALLLRQRGAHLQTLPQIRHPSAPTLFHLLGELPQYLKPRRPVSWSPSIRDRKEKVRREEPKAVAWHVYGESETRAIKSACRRMGVTVNSFLLKHLSRAVRPCLDDQSSATPWMVPVNLRGKVSREDDSENFTSYVSVEVLSYDNVHDVHRKIYNALDRGEHWANWYAIHLGFLMTQSMRRYLLAAGRATSRWFLGAFSNLGDWDPDARIAEDACRGAWLFAPPVLRSQMLGAGCVTFQNRMSLTLQTHPELTASPEDAWRWVEQWVKEIDMDLSGFRMRDTASLS